MMSRDTFLTAVCVAVMGCVVVVAAPALAGTAYFSFEGDLATAGDQVDFYAYLSRDVGSDETLYSQTFGGGSYGGTNASGDTFTADTKIDSVLELLDVADQTRGSDDDYPGLGWNSKITWVDSDEPLNPDPLPAGGYRLNLSSINDATGSFAVDLVGPADGMVFEGASPAGTGQINSLKMGTIGPGTARLELVGHGLTVIGPLFVANTGSALVQVTQDGLLTVQGPTTIHAGGTVKLDGGALAMHGPLQTFGTFDYGGEDPHQASDGILELWAPTSDPGMPANVGLRIGGGSGDAVLNGRSVVRVGGNGLLRIYGGSLQLDEGYTLAAHGISFVNALSLEEPPDCTNGDCEEPPECTNGDCEEPPECTNGDCTVPPESSNVYAQSIAVTGQLLLKGGYVQTEDGMTIAETGRLAGVGLIEGSVVNAGLVEPGHSPGSISIEGDFQQDASGTLVLEIDGDSEFDQLVVTGSADLGGTLQIVVGDGYRLGAGNVFPLIEASDPFYHFDNFTVVGGPLNVSFSSVGLIVSGVPEPASAVLLTLAVAGAIPLVRRRR